MRILVCNDDGVNAAGLALLADAARVLTPEVWVVAPERKWTAASHQLSFDRDLTLSRLREREYACSGAPADCVIAAMALLFATGPSPDLVVAGLNDKINVAEDVAYSGTMAIAREATFWGIPAISVSSDEPATFAIGPIADVLRVLWEARAQWSGSGHWLALNLPARLPAPLSQARVGRDKIGSACEMIESTPERTTFRIVRGRPGRHVDHDERARVEAGCIAVVRHRWFADAPVSAATMDAWNHALR